MVEHEPRIVLLGKAVLPVCILLCSPFLALAAEEPPSSVPEESRPHVDPTAINTEDEDLKEQIFKVNDALEELHQQIAQQRKQIQAVGTDAERAGLYARLDALRKEHDMLERLLHELVDEARATEWTKVDEALKRVRGLERYQEKQQRREDVLRDRRE
jgi:predicted  nucleic acid-binding Zn-ribbon protein